MVRSSLFLIMWLHSVPVICQQQKTVSPDEVVVCTGFNKYFRGCDVQGSIAIYDQQQHQWIVSDSVDVQRPTLPASTFKIINLLIALETEVIANENVLVKWTGNTDTLKYGYRPEIYHDMTVKKAFEVSAGWVFIELAKKIGKERYKKYLAASGYGNLNLSNTEIDFWNFGRFAISPIQQVNFLRKLYDGTLPFSRANISIVKKVMMNGQEAGNTFHAKTGWTRDGGINTGWWVGYVETNKGPYFFATRLQQFPNKTGPGFGNCRKQITKDILKDLGIL